jgi:hypothetical protein
MRTKGAIGLAVVLAACAGLAFAQQPKRNIEPSPSITGQWRFDTKPYGDANTGGPCQMSGTMTISRSAQTGAYTCRFVARERCPHGQWTAIQTCTATRQGAQLTMKSAIIKVEPATVSYAPDDWILTIRNGNLMIGELRSADIAPVEFKRHDAVIS